MSQTRQCWCGNADLLPFSPQYQWCAACESLVTVETPAQGAPRVVNDDRDFYGRQYWFEHQEKDLGFPNVMLRARTDLPERGLHWLRAVLKYKLPPGRTLELGSAHGGFVALLHWAGFDATGLDLSPWMVNFARQTFGLPMLLGPVEDQSIEPGSLDVIALMDVLEHLPDPVGAMRHCLTLLKPDGVLVIQTPRYPEGKTYAEMTAHNNPFLEQLKANEHLYLFSTSSIRQLFQRLGADHLAFETPIFAHYDMFLVVSRAVLDPNSGEAIEQALERTASGRMILALLDADTRRQNVEQKWKDAEADRARRLELIEEQSRRLGELEADGNQHRLALADVRQQLEAAEADRAARLVVIHEQGRRLGELEADRTQHRLALADVRQQLEAAEADRAARLAVIERQGQEITDLKAFSNEQASLIEAQEEQLRAVMAQLRTVQGVLHAIRSGRVYRWLRRLGRWGWVEAMLTQETAAN